jgi:hypothetical protein
MKAVICDVKGCGAIIEGDQVKVYSKKIDGCLVEINRASEQDLCSDCQRKLFAKGARLAWDDLKNKRVKKPATPLDNALKVVRGEA